MEADVSFDVSVVITRFIPLKKLTAFQSEYRLAATMKENLMFVKKNILCYVEQEI